MARVCHLRQQLVESHYSADERRAPLLEHNKYRLSTKSPGALPGPPQHAATKARLLTA
jgi:hypothetical protein